ncbi:hypothetical protein [Bacteroides thetaiotaomicron]|uniref:hypothetical protein n=1 Tax=Bacteroides thetaiotaomicron TaxID=818 RepID=UPI004062DD78
MITGELKKRVANFLEMEQRSGSMQLMTAEYVACMQIAKEDAAELLKHSRSNNGY